MESYALVDTLRALCKSRKCWGMYVSFKHQWHGTSPYSLLPKELQKAMPYFDFKEHRQIFIDGKGYFLFDTEEKCTETFKSTVGDDGPTETNPYNGPVKVYAITCSPDGELQTENT